MTTHPTPRLPRTAAILIALVALAAATSLTATASADGVKPCPNETVRQESATNPATGKPFSTELPECRAYELVSTANKNGSDALLSPLITNQHSGVGNFGLVGEGSVLWNKEVEPYSGSNNGDGDVYEATRGAGGWSQTEALEPAGSSSLTLFEIGAASSDLSSVVLKTVPLSPNAGLTSGEDHVVLRNANGSYSPIASAPYIVGQGQPFDVELSPDGRRVFLQTSVGLAGEPPSEGLQTYEWSAASGLKPTGVNNLGEPLSSCGAALAGEASRQLYYPNMSQDGSRVFLESPDPSKGAASGPCSHSQLYVRENGATTVAISKAPAGAAECEPGVVECEATFVGASADGSRVFFVTRSQLTPDKANNGDPDLYEYDVETHKLTRMSVGPPGHDDANVGLPQSTGVDFNINVEHSVIASSDGSHVYFTGRGQLVPGAGETQAANFANDTTNLYLYTGGSISYIATIGPGSLDGASTENPNAAAPLDKSVAAVTPNGSDLLFDTATRLTAYDSEGRGELYRYDAPTHAITCVSCNPSLALPTVTLGPQFRTSFWGGPYGPVQQFGGLSNDGQTVFFASTERLLPAAANVHGGGNPVFDVYEWHDGVLSLISSGTSPASDFLLGASPSGADVYFMTSAPLVQGVEPGAQIYDARLEGGFPAASALVPCASPEACRSMAATPPATVNPASVSVSGAGNVTTVTGSELPPPKSIEPPTRAQKLQKALRACHKDRSKVKRKKCEASARAKYGASVRRKAKKT